LIELKATHSLGETTAIDWEITPVVNDGARLHTSNTASDSGSNYINYQDKVYVSAGNELGEYTITARLSEFPEATATSTLKVIDVYCELICNEVDPTYGVINPAYVVNGMDSMFKAWIEPQTFVSNSNINASWSTSNSNISIVSNSLEKLIVRGNDLGECSLTLNIDNAQFITPKINTKVVNMVTNTIHACYNFSTADSVEDIEALRSDFENKLTTVNLIFKQVGMYFVSGVVTNQVNMDWSTVNFTANGKLDINYNMFNILSQELEVKIFFVDEICKGAFAGLQNNGIIIFKKNINSVTLGHEIGHSCRLRDIYIRDSGFSIDQNMRLLKHLIPLDCGGTNAKHFYSIKKHSDLILKLLMYGYQNSNAIDISFGNVYGVWYKWINGDKAFSISNAEIGFDEIGIRDLSIFGGNN
jgi:hypothetical protein